MKQEPYQIKMTEIISRLEEQQENLEIQLYGIKDLLRECRKVVRKEIALNKNK